MAIDIWAVCKTWRGECFALASLRSIYSHVRGVIYVHGDTSWDGRPGNTVRPIVTAEPDPDEKIVHLDSGSVDQTAQYDMAIDYLNNHNITYDYIMLIDTDEVWTEEAWVVAGGALETNHSRNTPKAAMRCRLHTFLKSPFYRITPPVNLAPVVFVHTSSITRGVLATRGSGLWGNSEVMESCWVYHYCSVRASLSDVWGKHISSCHIEREPIVPRDQWVKTVWNRLPVASNLSPLANIPHDWRGVEVIGRGDLPEAVRDMELVKAWKNYPQSVISPALIKLDKSMQIAGLPPDFGPNHPDWKIPSKRNRYQAWLEGRLQAQAAPATQVQETKQEAKPVPAPEPFRSPDPVVRPDPSRMSPSQRNKLYAGMKNEGRLAIMSVVSGAYQWYIPLFLDRIKKEYPGYDALVYVRGEVELSDPWKSQVRGGVLEKGPMDGYTTAALRFVYCNAEIEKYDYVLITDVDMMIMRETPNIVDQHMMALRVHGLDCYHNYVSSWVGDRPRVPGVHFVTKEWWRKTEMIRAKHQDELEKEGARDYCWDEVMLGYIITETGLKFPPHDQHMWAHHGVHLGDWRLRLQRKQNPGTPATAFDQMYLKKLLGDPQWMELVEMCAPKVAMLRETVKVWRRFVV